MNKLMLKIKKYSELYHPFILSVLGVFIYNFWLSKNTIFIEIATKILTDSILSLVVTVEVTLFGFLLAVLALILQMNNKFIELIMKAG